MTGKSIAWKMNIEELKEFLVYIRKPISAAFIMGGTGLMMEHLFTFDGFDLLDFWGHETLGLGLIIAGLLISTKWKQWNDLELWNVKNWFR